ncbi:crossover junction endodeoxyribonuclease RuvC [bacterium (Candidatus Blackallbacteria) CG17_big_fil_post_rev_8_21_14_2_50_48_46]|uniref:Crossover junction endodeoxyribonuclease RuvC n=1 Tax=bacterium (Candidatus Blackallbacteria) CG17_big_fil_post_rev_8_21_14_2_50_48_46 TaxID=2014261 RepID=A0A2M7FYF1_9BACT|nr:MAG: crossover junction endodeoxyribonuclease RuvC [bacterium (Candidatus Blackallbacteria) CG18_big_fil_WC_8_21_14_2_50_49_26]PIW14364.1 MAG: crossover junction endodeoxyribonuclease RuvC [bacterium (Candidatus Blackallbacteria) CG17_big_fil_post_rev_8_21_14_2_50_48_46]PIW45633.1 MAG: crossover junction endodeoxyribonuclease RuvC [bacterium (Candidatus Blackallbacteria) CG13_big_fil_rev_8_21_14_2_50_49_14]
MSQPTRILGIDPGSHRVGYGLLDCLPGRFDVVGFGTLETPPKSPASVCLPTIYEDLQELVKGFQPHVVAIEQLFFFRNLTTVMPVAQARGVILLSMAQAGLEVTEYTPLQVKMGLTGYGRASKREVQEAVAQWLGLEKIPKPDDAADALAIALCHAHQIGF